jgi:GNAT superfamily N-acetyltransferase
MPAFTPRILGPRDLPSALSAWSLAHPDGSPCAGDAVLASTDEAWGVDHDGELVALGTARTWGRIGIVHGLIVAEPLRRRGIGSALLEALLGSLAQRDVAVVGVEIDAGGAGALTFLARAAFRPMHLSFVLERTVPSEDDPGLPDPELMLLSGSDGVAGLDAIRGMSASVDAEFDPTHWLRDRLLRADAEVAILPRVGGGEPVGFAVLPRRPEGSESLFVSMTIAEDGQPHAGLRALVSGLETLARQRGLSRVQVAAPSRYWDATRALLDVGYRPRASFLRLTRHGAPERADTRRCCLTTWK